MTEFIYRDDDFRAASEATLQEIVGEIRDGRRVNTSLDGSSERLRAAFNKCLTDDEYRETLLRIPKVKSDSVFLKMFNVVAYPTETGKERLQPFTALLPIADDLQNSTTILFQPMPFIPMGLTPAQYLSADVFTDYRAWYKRLPKTSPDGKWLLETGRLRIGVTPAINTNLGLLKRCIIHRGTEDDLLLIKNIIFNRKLKRLRASDQVKALLTLDGMERFYRQYEPGEPMPFDYLRSYSSKTAIDNLARRLHQELGV